jgi:NAD-dependent dihydropyrimidine dehydrogenase PreA subunit
VITICTERCTGCAACLEVCPTGALFLVNGKADVDLALCSDCKDCLSACPTGAIVRAEETAIHPAKVPAVPLVPQVTQISTQPVATPLRSRVLPALSAAVAWVRREIVPLILDVSANIADGDSMRIQARSDTGRRQPSSPAGRGDGQQHRHRRRGGR